MLTSRYLVFYSPIFSADFHHSPPTQHKKPSHPYAKLSKELENEQEVELDRKDREKQWRLATCGGDNNVRVSSTTLTSIEASRVERIEMLPLIRFLNSC